MSLATTPLVQPPVQIPAQPPIEQYIETETDFKTEQQPDFETNFESERQRAVSAIANRRQMLDLGQLAPVKSSSPLSFAEPGAIDGTEAQPKQLNDTLEPYQKLVLSSRWITVSLAAVALAGSSGYSRPTMVVPFVVLAALNAFRLGRPIKGNDSSIKVAAAVTTELAVVTGAVIATGLWASPLVYMLIPIIMIGMLSSATKLTALYAAAPAAAMGIASVFQHRTPHNLRSTSLWAIEIMAFGVIVRVLRKVVDESLDKQSSAIDSMQKLTNANSLLAALHKVAQSLPSSLDLEDVLRSTIANARDLLPGDAITILIRDDTTSSWEVARCEGARLPESYEARALPPGVTAAVVNNAPVCLRELGETDKRGFLPDCASGIYMPLKSKQQLIGVIALENIAPNEDNQANVELLRRLAEPASVAIDNARWFGRIRRVAADEERVRIARDLHDRIGQSLAYLGFELDTILRHPDVEPVSAEIRRLRGDVTKVIAEIRETLYDIRTDVNGDKNALRTIKEFVERVGARSPSLTLTFTHDVTGSLPARQEREMWLIAQEAIVNAERHAKASNIWVDWKSDGHRCALSISDDGRGFAGVAGRLDSYGLRGLQERAYAIGARLEINTAPDKGTAITCRLN